MILPPTAAPLPASPSNANDQANGPVTEAGMNKPAKISTTPTAKTDPKPPNTQSGRS